MTVPRFWRESQYRYNLIGSECGNCGRKFFPYRTVCPNCHRKGIGKMKKIKFSGKGKIFTYTIVHSGTGMFQMQVPYVMAIVELDESPKVTAQIVDVDIDKIKIGMKVEQVFRKIGEDGKSGVIYYGYKFRPVEEKIT